MAVRHLSGLPMRSNLLAERHDIDLSLRCQALTVMFGMIAWVSI
jgi:hypothetical protein